MKLSAHIINEAGRPSKTILPPRSTKEISTVETLPNTVFSFIDLAKRSVFVVNIIYSGNRLLLYNGGLETQWIEHGEIIAEY